MTINEYFGRVVVVNLRRRPDRWADVIRECEKTGLVVERFEAIDAGPDDGNRGCSASHRAVMDLVVQNQWPRCLVLEDDFKAIYDNTQERFASMIGEVPEPWDQIYLGGHYAEKPRARVSPHVILIGQMKTTSSYGVTLEAARELRDLVPIGTGDAIDNLWANYNATKRAYIFQPRLFVQRAGYSDLQKREMSNEGCMTDSLHENLV